MEHSLLEIWETMGFLARLVAISLVGMGLATVAVSIERVLVLNKAFGLSAKFAAKARPLIDDGDFEAVADLARGKEYNKVPLPQLTRHGIEAFRAAKGEVPPIEMSKRELARRLEELGSEARRGMGILASTGSTAPFIGLFGTVIGIITAFQGIAASGGGGIAAVSAGIAEALIVTAVGLIVAIMAVLIYNYLSARFDRLDMNMNHAASELVDRLEDLGGRTAGK